MSDASHRTYRSHRSQRNTPGGPPQPTHRTLRSYRSPRHTARTQTADSYLPMNYSNDNGYSWGDSNSRAQSMLAGLERLSDSYPTRLPVAMPSSEELNHAAETGEIQRGPMRSMSHVPRASHRPGNTTRIRDDPFQGKWTHFSFCEQSKPLEMRSMERADAWGHPHARVHINTRRSGLLKGDSIPINLQGEANHVHPLGNGTVNSHAVRSLNSGPQLQHGAGRAGGMHPSEWSSNYQDDTCRTNSFWRPDHSGGPKDRWDKDAYAPHVGNRYMTVGYKMKDSYMKRYDTLSTFLS